MKIESKNIISSKENFNEKFFEIFAFDFFFNNKINDEKIK